MLRGSIPDVEFGCFAFATMLVTTPVAAFSQLAAQVFLPTLASAIREDSDKALRQFVRSKWVFTALAFCFACGGLWLGPPLVALLGLNRTFSGLAWMVQLLGVRASMEIYAAPTSTTLLASGASRYSAMANIVRLIILVAGLYLTIGHWGLRGAMWILVGAPFISYAALLPGLRRHMPGAMGIELAASAVFLTATGICTAIALTH
jgi:O-antigen/teichoic acid export membrane protein